LSVASLVVVKQSETILSSASAAILLMLAIISHHFVAMGAFGLVTKPAFNQGGAFLPHAALSLAIAAVTITVVVGGLIGAISDRRSHLKIAIRNVQLDAALSNMGQGLCMFGADNRLQLWNERYLEIYHIPAGRIAAGLKVEQLLDISKAAGIVFKDLEQHVIGLQDAIERRVPTSRISELADGRTIVVTHCPHPKWRLGRDARGCYGTQTERRPHNTSGVARSGDGSAESRGPLSGPRANSQ
jgi:diguanylate cyclase